MHEDDLGFYRNMSMISLIYGSVLFEKEKDRGESIKIAREMSIIMFTYWLHTRHGGLLASPGVDTAIKKTYKNFFFHYDYEPYGNPFHDPISWGTNEVPIIEIIDNPIDKLTKEQYQILLGEFVSFLSVE